MDTTKDQGNTYRWYIFGVVALQYLVVYFHRVAPAVVAPELVHTFSISGTSLGILASAYFYAYAIMQIPVGILSDSWGPRKVITLFSLMTAVATFVFGFSPNFTTAVVSRIFVGLGVSAIFVCTMKLLAFWYRPLEYGRISSILMAVGGIGWFTATTPLAYLTHYHGWRFAFIVISTVSLVFSAFTWFVVADRPEKKGFHAIAPPIPPGKKRRILHDLKSILGEKYFWPIAIWFIFRGGALFGFFGLWAGPYLIDIYGLPKHTTGNVLSMIAFAMIFVSPIIGHLSDRTFQSRKQILVWSSVLNCLCFLFMVIYFDSLSIPLLYLLFFLMGITISSVGSIAMTAMKELFPLDIAGTAIGTMNLFPFIGGIIFQPLMGYVLDKGGRIAGAYHPSGYRTLVLIYFVTSVFALGSIVFSKETLRKE